jgi:predicted CXXCH cytochrome family protein
MLRVHTGSTYVYFSQASDPKSQEFCFACHGDDNGTAISGVGGSAAYGTTGGDHNQSGYGASAHGTGTVYANDHPSTDPAAQCLACHHQHASAADRLIDYRASGTTDADAYAQAGLCFECHSDSSSESKVAAGYSAPFAWNDRDVEAEFTGGASAHPWVTAASGASLTCVNCHNVHFVEEGGSSAWDASRVVDPDDTTAPMTGSTYGSAITDFCIACHDGDPPEATVTASVVVPYTPAFSSVTAPYFPGWDKTATGYSFADAGHAGASAADGRALCENCHDPHASDFPRLTAWTKPSAASGLDAGTRENTSTSLSREEHLCYRCHGNGTEGDRAAGAKDVATKMALTYAHPADDYVGRHADTETASSLSTRHAECPDCHDPHAAREVGGTATQDSKESTAGGALYGVYGAAVTYAVQNWGAPSSFAAKRIGGDTTDFEAYVCFKCHSTNTAQPSTQIDVARGFNPSNHSSHNVLGQSTSMQSAFTVIPQGQSTSLSVTWALPAASLFLKSGWTRDSKMTCSDCHTNDQTSATQAKGPHGSSAEWLIDPDYSRDFSTVGLYDTGVGMAYDNGSGFSEATDVICAKCHDLYHPGQGDGGWSNEPHSRNGHMIDSSRETLCVDCHVAIPHGIGRPRLLGYTTDGDYASVRTLSIAVVSHTLSGGAPQWSKDDCRTSGCHSKPQSNMWP